MIRITIDDNKEVEIKTTKGLEETELAADATIEILRQRKQVETQESKLMLCWVSSKGRFKAIDVIKEIVGIDLEKARKYVDDCIHGDEAVLAYGSKEKMSNISVQLRPYNDIMKAYVSNIL